MNIYGIEIVTDEAIDHNAWEFHYIPTMTGEVRRLRDVLKCMGLSLDRIDISKIRP